MRINLTILLFWLAVIGLLTLDTLQARGSRVEPPLIAYGSGVAASGGHCSGR